jgi:hypothetical protein
MNAVKAVAKYLSTIRAEEEEEGLLHLQTPHTCVELLFIKKYLDSFEYINSSAMWIQILTLLTEKKFTD